MTDQSQTDAEASVARIAAGRQGIVTWAELRGAGMTRHAIARHVASGWLVQRHRGIYQLGVFPGPFGREMAALLACGPRAVLSHWAAAIVHALCSRMLRPIDVSVAGGSPRRRPGIRPHRATALPDCDVVTRHGMRITTPARTLLDLAATTPRADLERLVEEAQVQRLVGTDSLRAVIERGAHRSGVPKLRAIADLLDEPLVTRSEAERRLLAVVRRAGLRLPRTNVRVAGWEVDAVWDAERLVVEVDGYEYHGTRGSFERDRRKDAELMLAGYRVVRVTWHRLTREPSQVVALLEGALRINLR